MHVLCGQLRRSSADIFQVDEDWSEGHYLPRFVIKHWQQAYVAPTQIMMSETTGSEVLHRLLQHDVRSPAITVDCGSKCITEWSNQCHILWAWWSVEKEGE